MDQNEIDALLKSGSLEEDNKKQQDIVQNLKSGSESAIISEKKKKNKGEVMGQLSRVSEEAEEGTNLVMNYLENMLNIATRQKDFVTKIDAAHKNNTLDKSMESIIAYFKDSSFLIEDLIFNAMDAFQFQDINRQKLMKVMHTLAQLNSYLNDLLGFEEVDDDEPVRFGKQIEDKTLDKDIDKTDVDDIVAQYKTSQES